LVTAGRSDLANSLIKITSTKKPGMSKKDEANKRKRQEIDKKIKPLQEKINILRKEKTKYGVPRRKLKIH